MPPSSQRNADDAFTYAETFHPEILISEEPTLRARTGRHQPEQTKSLIDAETSAAIRAGFDYAVDGATYHFSYALDDQQNFSDTANVCLMKQAGMPGLPDSSDVERLHGAGRRAWCA